MPRMVYGLDLAVDIQCTFDTRNLEASMEVPVGAEIDRYKAFCASS